MKFPEKSITSICSAIALLSGLAFTPNASFADEYDREEGVNLLTGSLQDTIPMVSIGHGEGSLSHAFRVLGTNGLDASTRFNIGISDTANAGQYSYFVRLPGGANHRFLANTDSPANSTSFSEWIGHGHDLSYHNGVYTFTSKHGAVASFTGSSVGAKGTQIVSPNGATLWYNSSSVESLRNNYGYQIKAQDQGQTRKFIGINNAIEYCSPTIPCVVASHWPKGESDYYFANFHDPEGNHYELSEIGSSNVTVTLTYPDDTITSQGIYNSSGHLTQSTRAGVQTSFNVSENTMGTPNTFDDERTTTMTYVGGGSSTTVSKITGGLILSKTDVLGQSTTYTYNSNNLVTSVSAPGGVSTHYSYDSRGNITEVRQKGSGMTDLVSSAGYPSSCSSSTQKTCNKPVWTKDQLGNQTDYTYHSQSGNIASITGPSDGVNPRPVTNFTYIQMRAKVKNSSNQLVNSTPIWQLKTTTAFAGTSKQVTTTYNYNVNKNLTPSSVVRSGGGVTNTVSFTYDNYGNLLYQDGPLPGTADRTAQFYDKARRMKGAIGIDPDGSGPMLRQSQKVTYAANGRVEKTDKGTATNYTLSALNATAIKRTQYNHYDTHGRLSRTKLLANGVSYAATDYSYDSRGRNVCTAQRLNPVYLSGGYSNACALNSTGAFGQDRITKRTYDVASRVTQTISAFGTPDASTETATYYNYGPVRFAYDGNGNRSYFRYDGFLRPWITYFPKASGTGHNGSDYERYYYDTKGRVNRFRQRDGQNVYYSYNTIGLTTFVNAPGSSEDTSFAYDIMGNVTSISKAGQNLTSTYDTYGRKLTETSSIGTVSYMYDNYGRRTQMNYPGTDSFFIKYDYVSNGSQVAVIRERNTSTLLANYAYDSEQRPQWLSHPYAGVTKTYNYDPVSRLSSMTNNLSGSSMDQTLSFAYNPAGQIASQTNSNPAYDPTPVATNDTFTVNGLNQITGKTGSPAFSHNTAGNLTSGDGKTYGYDYNNRLTSVSGSGLNGSVTYDPLSRVRTVTSGGTTRTFVYDGSDLIAEYEGSNLKKRYVHGPGVDQPLVEYTTGLGGKVWLVSDVRGSVTNQVTGAGASVATNSYDEYGTPGANNSGRFQYTGQLWMEELGLYYYKARFYSPELKRFLTPDPSGYGDGMNMYAYVAGDPVNYTDPSGLSACGTNGGWGTRDGQRSWYTGAELESAYGISCGNNDSNNWHRSRDLDDNGDRDDDYDGIDRDGGNEGHDFSFERVICRNSSLLSGDQQKAVISRFTVPRPQGSLAYVPTGETRRGIVVDPRFHVIPGGNVDTTISNDGFRGVNQTVPGQHFFAGTITRQLITSPNNELIMRTRGVGTVDGFAGGLRDNINEWQGPKVFHEMDRMATAELHIFFPGC